jgi:hypothetical protein
VEVGAPSCLVSILASWICLLQFSRCSCRWSAIVVWRARVMDHDIPRRGRSSWYAPCFKLLLIRLTGISRSILASKASVDKQYANAPRLGERATGRSVTRTRRDRPYL